MRTLLAVSLAALAAPAAADPTIIGGSAVPPGRWPDAVAVLGVHGTCTGTLIAPDVVLTAGHCADTSPRRVIANTTNYSAAGGVQATVKSVTAYPGWETSYDVAIVVLNAPIADVPPRPIGTACTFQSFAASTQVHLVGFGLTDEAAQGDNTRLNEVMAPVMDPDCSGGNGCVPGIAPGGEFIAGGTGIDTCNGDSGGPVYLDTPRGVVVVGAVSRGLDDSSTPCGGGGIYVRTDKLVPWIEATAGKPVSKDPCSASMPPAPGGGGGHEPGEDAPDVTGGCSAGGGGAGLGMLALALRRRRRG